jgi:hypothetical protein
MIMANKLNNFGSYQQLLLPKVRNLICGIELQRKDAIKDQ